MKKRAFIISLCAILLMLMVIPHTVYAKGEDKEETINESNWVEKAFGAAHDFLTGTTPKDELGIASPLLKLFTNIVNTINRVLLVLLFGLSAISLSVIGVRYMVSGASPGQRQAAQNSLRTAFIGMAYGFGAFTIWRIAMGIVSLILSAMANSGNG